MYSRDSVSMMNTWRATSIKKGDADSPRSRAPNLTFSFNLARRPQTAMATTPTLIWAQRREKVFVTWESVSSTDVNVTLADGLLSLDGKDKAGTAYKLENMPLWDEIESEESKWFKNDRCAAAAASSRGARAAA